MRVLRVWLVLVVAMVANGAVRALVLEPLAGPAAARLASVAIGVVLILLITRSFIRSAEALSNGRRTAVAAVWLVLTIAFEFGFGHWVMGASWGELAANYDLLQGRLWPLVLVAIAVSPFLWQPGRKLHFAPHGA